MHKSDELQEVVKTVFDKLNDLEVETDSTTIIVYKEGVKEFDCWIQNTEGNYSARIFVPYFEQSTIRRDFYNCRKSELFSRGYTK